MKLACLLIVTAISFDSDSAETDDVEAALAATIAEAVVDTKVVSNKDFRVQLLQFAEDADNHGTAASLGLIGDTAVHIYRKEEIFISIVPQVGDGKYVVTLRNADDEEMTILEVEFSDSILSESE